MTNKMLPVPFSKKRGQLLWPKDEVAKTFAIIETGMLAARTHNDPKEKDCKVVFKFVPGMLLGESSILGTITGRDELRNTCIFVPDNCEEVTGFEYPPEFLKREIENGQCDLGYSLITNLWAHTIVNYHRLQYGNEDNDRAQDSIKSGLISTIKSMRRLRREIENFNEFSKEFRYLFYKRDESRNLYTVDTKYKEEDGLDEAYKAFLYIFDNKTDAPSQFRHLLLKMIDFIKEHKMQGYAPELDDLATEYEC